MHNFNTPTPITAVLNIPAGRVQIIAADRSDTAVEVIPANISKSRDVKAAEQTTVEHSDGVLRIEVPTKDKRIGPSGSVEVTVQLPTNSRIKATAACTELRAVGHLDAVSFEGAYKRIKIDEATRVRLTAVAGDVEVGRVHDSAEISTSKGDIRITEATRGTLVLQTQAGDVSVGAASGVSATLDAGTSYGRVSNALKNNGTTELDIHATTGYGDISAASL